MPTRRLLSGSRVLALCVLGLASMSSHAGLFSHKPKGPPLLGSHPTSDAKDARRDVLKQRGKAVPSHTVKPGKTITSQRTHPGKNLLGQPVKH
jgi:hypothetical protein